MSSLPECINSIFDCNSTIPSCHNSARFDFPSLWTITAQYSQQCPGGPWLFPKAGQIALTNDICKIIAGAEWKEYPGSDIWARLTTWKVPLLQLVANSPRAPLGFWVEMFTVVHFLGDPIGTIADLLRKIDACQSRAVFWQDQLDGGLVVLRDERTVAERQRLWKSLTIIVDSFDEWGSVVGDRAQGYLLAELSRLSLPHANPEIRKEYLRICLQTADALAADRSTKFVPVTIAQAFFIGSVAIAMIRTESSGNGPDRSTYVNIEMYSIAFTAQYFWVIFVVFWTSIVGVSQTAAAVPRILRRLRHDLEQEFAASGMAIDMPDDELDNDNRIYDGGIYSWQPARRWTSAAHNSALEHRVARDPTSYTTKLQRLNLSTILRIWPVVQYLLPLSIVAAAAGTGQLISGLVPPEGWSCRSTGMLWMFLTWLAGYTASLLPLCRNNYKFQFWVTFIKDLLVVAITFAIVMKTQFGIYNRCDCYTQYGRMGLQLPFMPYVDAILQSRLRNVYPAVVTMGIVVQLVFAPGLLVWRYKEAVQVFLQRDDGRSNLDWWFEGLKWIGSKWDGLQTRMVQIWKCLRTWRLRHRYDAVDRSGMSHGPARVAGAGSRDEEADSSKEVEEVEMVETVETYQ